jgi:anthranilate phosphoribosyltransferase
LRTAATPLDVGELEVADNCGTGGDGSGTVNISTAAALVAAEAGVRVAKHGNRSVSSRCGSADVLEQLGVVIDAPPAVARACLDRAGICFLFAPQYHAGVRHAMPVRRALGVRTIFNLLGPLVNPAAPALQLVGVYDPQRCRVMAETLALLGCKRALVVHGGGLDELALHAPTHCAELRDGRVQERDIEPSTMGVSDHPLAALRGGAPEENAAWLHGLVSGKGNDAHRQAVALNAGALIWLSDVAESHRSATTQAMDLLAGDQVLRRLERWIEVSRGA